MTAEHPDPSLRDRLTPEQFRVTQEGATEPPFSGAYCHCRKPGTYRCICCGLPLFRSEHKFESGTGWPSFYAPAVAENVVTAADLSHGMRRTELRCAGCGAHLGHVFDDGPPPTGLRYCLNSAALHLESPGKEA